MVIKKDAEQYSGTWPEKYKQFLQNKDNRFAKQAWNTLILIVEVETKIKSQQFITALKEHVIEETASYSAWKAAVHHDREIGAYSTIYQNTLKNDLINKRKENNNRGYLAINNYNELLQWTKDINNLFDHSAIMPLKLYRKIRGHGKMPVLFTLEDMSALKQNELDFLAMQAQTAKRGIYCTDTVVAQAMGCHASTIGRIKKRIKSTLIDKFVKEVSKQRPWYSQEDDDGGFYGAGKGRGTRDKFTYNQVGEGVGWGFEGYAENKDGEIINVGWRTEKPSYSRSDDDDDSFEIPKEDRITKKRLNLSD